MEGVIVMKKSSSQKLLFVLIIVFCIIILCVSIFITLKNTSDLRSILEHSIEAQLISTSIAARGILDVEKFYSYNSIEDINADREHYDQTLIALQSLKLQVGAEYIYALKYIDGTYYFIFDTDFETDTRFEEYEISPVHFKAFEGMYSAGVMNVVDEFGSFNTGAIPIWRNNQVIGIISTDIEDVFIQENDATALRNAVILVVTLLLTMGALTGVVAVLLRRVDAMQDTLFNMANYDILTGLPNRQYLMSYLPEISEKAIKNNEQFALMLIDLDNFKLVNDNAGHDAGDELLVHIAQYLEHICEKSKSFRPPAGILNVSARIGGDEFIQIVPGVNSVEEAQKAAKNVLDNFHTQTNNRYIDKYKVSMSIGVALFPYHTANYNVLIKYADTAMYYAKTGGKNSYCIYSDDLATPDDPPESEHDRRSHKR